VKIGILVLYIGMAICSVTLPLNVFGGQIAPIFFLPIVVSAPFGIYANRYSPMFLLIASSGYLIGLLSFLSDVLPIEFHYLGYATTLISSSGLYLIFRDYIRYFNISYSSSILLSASMPDSLYVALLPLLEKGASIFTIRKFCDGNSYVFTLFVDLIGWGEMGADLSVDPLNFAKEGVFSKNWRHI
jgi:hypothetical protein